MAGTGGKVLQYRSATGVFTAFDTPDDRTAFGVWGADGSSLWAVGGDLDAPDDSGFVWRYDGQSWMSEDLSAVLPQGVPILYKVWGRSGSDLYVVGRLGVVLHYDGSAWTRVPTDTTRTLFTVNGNDTLVAAAGGLGDAVLLEEEGGTFVNRAPAATPQMNGVFVPHDGQAVAAGNLASLARRVNGTWVLQDAAFATTRDFHGVWLDPEGGIWAVGGNLSASLNDGILAYVGPSSIGTSVAE
jgi:hypothetical protein